MIHKDNADALTLCSMHASKGLGWKVVFAVRMIEGECPLSVQTEPALEEERRLAYVAMSRAKELLHLTHVAMEPKGNGSEQAVRSRFVDELPKEHLKFVQAYY